MLVEQISRVVLARAGIDSLAAGCQRRRMKEKEKNGLCSLPLLLRPPPTPWIVSISPMASKDEREKAKKK